MKIFPAKPSGATEKFAFDFTEALNGAAIVGTPTLTADGVTIVSSDVNGDLIELLLSGGTEGTVATIGCSLVTDGGETPSELGVLPIGGEAVSLADAKAAQRIEASDDDALLAGFLRAAVRHIETRTGKNLTQQVETQVVDGFPRFIGSAHQAYFGTPSTDVPIRLWKGPVSQVLEVTYDDTDGAEQTLADFRLVEGKAAKLLPAFGACWPVTAFGPGTVRISYIAGFDPADRDLAVLSQAAILLFGHFNANREAVMADTRAAAIELPLGVEALISPFCSPGIA